MKRKNISFNLDVKKKVKNEAPKEEKYEDKKNKESLNI